MLFGIFLFSLNILWTSFQVERHSFTRPLYFFLNHEKF